MGKFFVGSTVGLGAAALALLFSPPLWLIGATFGIGALFGYMIQNEHDQYNEEKKSKYLASKKNPLRDRNGTKN
jgi:hypothetical protein